MQDNLTINRIALYSLMASLFISEALKKDIDNVKGNLEVWSKVAFIDGADVVASKMVEAINKDKEAVLYEFEVLFNLPFGDFINSSVSFYHDEREFGAQTVMTKEIMKEAGYIKADFYSAGEDEFGYLCALSAKLLSDSKFDLQKKLFFEVLLPYASKFIDTILSSKRAEFYKDGAELFALFLAFEKSYFEFFGKL